MTSLPQITQIAAKDSVYTLNAGSKGIEIERLWFQHTRLFKPLTGGLLPSSIRAHLAAQPAPAVADVAHGTGIWLFDLAQELPASARLDGYDFDTSKFPADTPANIKLGYGNILEPFPEEVRGVYDLVHVRLLVYGLRAEEWEVAARNMLTLLKPGGWLLWDELGYNGMYCMPMTEEFYRWHSVEVRYARSVGRDPYSATSLIHRVKSAGFVDCSRQIFVSSSDLPEGTDERKFVGHVGLKVMAQSMMGMIAKRGFEWVQSQGDIDEIVIPLTKDVDSGTTEIGLDTVWTIGRRPESES